MSIKRRQTRNTRGAAIIGLVLAILFFMLFVGLFAFDANRAEMCQRELIAACDSSSICGTAMLTSYDTSPGNQGGMTVAQAQNNAAAYAINMFKKCTVLGAQLTNAQIQGSTGALYAVTQPQQCNLLIGLGNPDNGFAAVAPGDAKGRTVMIFTCYGYQPAFLSSMPFGIAVTPLKASSFGGLPQVDAVVAFDYSGSMDDFTGVLFVRREWCWPAWKYQNNIKTKAQGGLGTITGAAAKGYPMYTVITGPSPGGAATLSEQLNWNYSNSAEGSGVNVLPPQNLEQSNNIPSGNNTAVQNALFFDYATSNSLRANPIFDPAFTQNTAGNPSLTANDANFNQKQNGIQMSASNDYGQPPGNWKPYFTGLNDWQLLNLQPSTDLADYQVPGQPQNPTPSNCGGSMFNPSVYNLANPGGLWMPWIPTNYFPNHGSSGYGASGVYGNQPAGSWHQGVQGTNGSKWVTTTGVQYSAYQLVGDNMHYTDLVVNIVDPTGGGSEYLQQPINAICSSPVYQASGVTTTFPADEPDPRLAGKTFSFPNLAFVVEAARGNLDNATNYNGAQLANGVILNSSNWNNDPGSTWSNAGPTGTTGLTPMTLTSPSFGGVSTYYQLAYERLAMLESQPYATACDGCQNGFFYKLATLADTRFSLVGFSSVAEATTAGFPPANNCLPAFGGGTATVKSAGTATTNSCFHSYYQWFDANDVGDVINANSNNAMHHCWWRSFSSTNGCQNGASSSSLSTDLIAWNAEQVAEYNGNNGYGNSNGETGFKLPRLPLSTASIGGAPTSQVCMAASIPVVQTSVSSPYVVPPVGDIWSATANANDANGVWNGRPSKATYSDEALYSSYAMFDITGKNNAYQAATRKAARRAIVFFTDGEPTGGITGTTGTNTTSVATADCQPNTVAIFAIGLNATGNAQLTSDQYSFLGDNLNANYGGAQKGLAYFAGNGGRFFQCATGSDVRAAFASIARRLSQAQQ